MEHDLVLEGKVVTRRGVEELEVGVSEGRIEEIGKYGLKGSRRIRGGRGLIFPGFVDIHVHLREPGWEHKEDFRTGTKAAIHGGVTTVVDMPNNPVPATTPEVLEQKRRLAKGKAKVDVLFYGGVPAETADQLRLPTKMVSGFKIYLAETTGNLLLPLSELPGALARIAKVGRNVSLHCEDQATIARLTKEFDGVKRQDVRADIRPPESETRSVEDVVAALEKIGGIRANICHASVGETLSIVERARMRGLRLECEAALHHLFFNRKALLENPLLGTNPPLREEEDRAALVRGLMEGQVSFLVTDHAPHTLEEKMSGGASGVPGLDDYGHLVSWLIRAQGIDPVQIGKVAAAQPAGYVGTEDRGEIAVGKMADFAILELDSPEKVRNDDVESKCGWSPYEGFTFPGRVRWTIKSGEPLLEDFELVS